MNKKVYEFISIKTSDPIIERKTCAITGQPFAIFQSDLDFFDKISPTFNGVKYQIPTPKLCPEERQRRRLVRRNERKLYRRKCDATGKEIISIYSPDKLYKAYNQDARFGDSRDARDYGSDVDLTKSMWEQFAKLLFNVPKRGLSMGVGSENCDYVNAVGRSKSCYLIFSSSNDEECYYGTNIMNCKNCIDNTGIRESEHLYGCVDSVNCYKCFFLESCLNCKDSWYLRNCKNCHRCFGCVNIENQQYYIFNQPFYNKESYESELSKITEEIRITKMDALIKNIPIKSLTLSNVESGFGNMLYNCKNIYFGQEVNDSENIKYGASVHNSQDCVDVDGIDGYDPGGCVKLLDSGSVFQQCSDVLFSANCRNNCHYLYYCIECRKAQNCFLCSGLNGQAYCILNKQYTKEEYNKLIPQIIEKMKADGEWGEAVPIPLSVFAYNETIAQERLSLTREEAIARGYKRQDNNYDPVISSGTATLSGDQIPTDASIVSDEILKKIFVCEVSGRPFRIIKQELDFYRKHTLPLPRKHPDIRHLERMHMRPERQLYLRHCDNCGIEMLSVYKEESGYKVYCEQCYNKEIYG